jgi:hypothetical protein
MGVKQIDILRQVLAEHEIDLPAVERALEQDIEEIDLSLAMVNCVLFDYFAVQGSSISKTAVSEAQATQRLAGILVAMRKVLAPYPLCATIVRIVYSAKFLEPMVADYPEALRVRIRIAFAL